MTDVQRSDSPQRPGRESRSVDYDVAIVGYGPVGALTALLLAESGLRVAVLERTVDPVELPRAVGLDGESVRTFQSIGLADRVSSILQPARERDQVCFTNSRREPLLGIDLAAHGPTGWRDMAYFDQPELEALLRDEVARRDRIEVFLGTEVKAIEPGDDRVVLRSASPEAPEAEVVSARFVVGCDGASSFVRRTLGIPWQSLGYDQDWLVVDILTEPGADLPLATMQVCDPERLTTYVCVKDPNRRWEFQLKDGERAEDMLRPERIEALLDDWLPADRYTIRRAAVYQFHAANAERWRVGRVLLAGDAAHQTPPFLGQGLNSGLRDAANLGWKIPLVVSGQCDARLLDTYAAERDPHARDLVERAVGIGKLMENLAAREAGRHEPHGELPLGGGSGGARGGGGAFLPSLREGLLVVDQVGPQSPVGTQIRQPTVRRRDGVEQKLDALLGRGFAIVGRKEEDVALGAEASAVWRRLDGRCVALEALELVHGSADRLFDRHSAAVVRPDRYVYGVVDEGRGLDELVIGLGRDMLLR